MYNIKSKGAIQNYLSAHVTFFQALQISSFTKMTSTPLVFQKETFTDAYKYFIGKEYEM